MTGYYCNVCKETFHSANTDPSWLKCPYCGSKNYEEVKEKFNGDVE